LSSDEAGDSSRRRTIRAVPQPPAPSQGTASTGVAEGLRVASMQRAPLRGRPASAAARSRETRARHRRRMSSAALEARCGRVLRSRSHRQPLDGQVKGAVCGRPI
jgi:hypothetical protein